MCVPWDYRLIPGSNHHVHVVGGLRRAHGPLSHPSSYHNISQKSERNSAIAMAEGEGYSALGLTEEEEEALKTFRQRLLNEGIITEKGDSLGTQHDYILR